MQQEEIVLNEEASASPAESADATAATVASSPLEAAPAAGISRRAMVAGIGATCALLGLGVTKLVPAEAKVRPPGAQDENDLLSRCTRCGRCVEACPHHVIAFQHMEDGLLGMRLPIMNFDEGYCTACVDQDTDVPLCARVCPTDAILRQTVEAAQHTVIGIADIDTEQCLAYRLAGCRFCYDACEFEAIVMDNGRPVVVPDKCTGCGACEAVCVSLKEGAIRTGVNRRAIIIVGKEQ